MKRTAISGRSAGSVRLEFRAEQRINRRGQPAAAAAGGTSSGTSGEAPAGGQDAARV